MRQTFVDVPCTVCGCVCDDLRLTVEQGRIVETVGACRLAEPWFRRAGTNQPPVARVRGEEVDYSRAIAEAAALLRVARSPLIYGLSRSNTDGQRAAVALAERLGATVDTTAARGHASSILALQESGESTCTLGEVSNRADLVVFWGSDPMDSHPRHLERYALEPAGLFVPGGRADRTLVVVDVRPTQTAALADQFVQVRPGEDFELLWTLRGLLRSPPADAGRFASEPPCLSGWSSPPPTVAGVPWQQVCELADRLRRCRVGIIFFGLGLARAGNRTVEALLRLGIDCNRGRRFYVRRMRVSGDVAGADSVLAWQTGFPFAVNFATGVPRYNPGEFTGPDMLARGEVDCCVLVGTGGVRRFEKAARAVMERLPTIALEGPDSDRPFSATVEFTTAVPGLHTGGTVYRLDEVPLGLKVVLPTHYPSDAQVLSDLMAQLQKNSACATLADTACDESSCPGGGTCARSS